jgi:hypothetical protein
LDLFVVFGSDATLAVIMPYRSLSAKKSKQRKSLPSSKRPSDVQRTAPTSDLWRSWKPMQFCTGMYTPLTVFLSFTQSFLVNDSRNGEKVTFRLEEEYDSVLSDGLSL